MNDPAVKNPARVAVTGAAGQIGYSLLFRIASGAMLGPDQPVELAMLEIPPAMGALDGVMMELDDCAFPLLAGRKGTSDPNEAFEGADYALLVGSMPRKAGMERSDLLQANGGIFTVQGKALSDAANPGVRVLVVGNPANTNCLIAMRNAPNIADGQFTAMTRLDHNRAIAQLAGKAGMSVNDVTRMTIWGNHSATQYPDIFHTEVGGHNAAALVDDQTWLEDDFIPTVQQRGAAIIGARGASSAASAASAAVDHMRDWTAGTPGGDWVSMAIPSTGDYGAPEGIITSYPVTVAGSQYHVVTGLELDDFSRSRIEASWAELVEERDTVAGMGLLG